MQIGYKIRELILYLSSEAFFRQLISAAVTAGFDAIDFTVSKFNIDNKIGRAKVVYPHGVKSISVGGFPAFSPHFMLRCAEGDEFTAAIERIRSPGRFNID